MPKTWNPYDHPRWPENGEFSPEGKGEVIIGRKEDQNETRTISLEKTRSELYEQLGLPNSASFADILFAPGFESLSEREKYVALGRRHESSVRRLASVRIAERERVKEEALAKEKNIFMPKLGASKPQDAQKPDAPTQNPGGSKESTASSKYSERELEEAQQFVREHFAWVDRLEKLNEERHSEEADRLYQNAPLVGLNGKRLNINPAIDDWENSWEARWLNSKGFAKALVASSKSKQAYLRIVFNTERERGYAMQRYIDGYRQMPKSTAGK